MKMVSAVSPWGTQTSPPPKADPYHLLVHDLDDRVWRLGRHQLQVRRHRRQHHGRASRDPALPGRKGPRNGRQNHQLALLPVLRERETPVVGRDIAPGHRRRRHSRIRSASVHPGQERRHDGCQEHGSPAGRQRGGFRPDHHDRGKAQGHHPRGRQGGRGVREGAEADCQGEQVGFGRWREARCLKTELKTKATTQKKMMNDGKKSYQGR
ncbi:hypothetical protein, variant 2 [Cladophialophora immunda]|nr:hypothetical protein, variant 1 [Cladophialophora immunda]XP_016245917.1 hypothetical protein, variant 2 [Cladophialophora immunda]KIW25700.1 hypothetical protein, variant 1 [Cladophialophora immunda]KIW25701.1 hypothetical protein, variant 2 [Cladophialophora immunda]